jgi:hypothetical protein
MYGRRAGQKLPLWSYGEDFAARDRLVPEATPEFAATDSLVADLISPTDQPVLRPDLTPADVQAVWQRWRQRVVHILEQGLVRSHLFVQNPNAQALAVMTSDSQSGYQTGYQGIKLVAVWGAVGILLTLQANWLMGWMLQAQPTLSQRTEAETSTELAAPVLSSTLPDTMPEDEISEDEVSESSESDEGSNEPKLFNPEGFTQTDTQADTQKDTKTATQTDTKTATQTDIADTTADRQPDQPSESKPTAASENNPSESSLPHTPIQAADTQITAEILAESPSLPTFNSRQFDDKLKLYYRFIQENGKPPDVLVLGSSRALRGVDPVALNESIAKLGNRDITIFNFGINGATAQVSDLLVHQILTPEQLPRLILWADGARAFNSGGTDVTYNGIVASEGYQQLMAGTFPFPQDVGSTPPQQAVSSINTSLNTSYESLDRWLSDRLAQVSGTYEDRDRLKHSLQTGFTQLVPVPAMQNERVSSPNSASLGSSDSNQPLVNPDGFLSLAVQFNPATYYQKYSKVTGQYDSDYEKFQIAGRQETALRSLLQYAQSQDVPVVFVNLPLTEDYLDPFRREYEQTFREFMVELALQQPNLTFRDLGDLWTTRYSYFSDPSHLNRYGAYAVSQRLAQDPLIPWAGKANKN